jgi:hypothetical protein
MNRWVLLIIVALVLLFGASLWFVTPVTAPRSTFKLTGAEGLLIKATIKADDAVMTFTNKLPFEIQARRARDRMLVPEAAARGNHHSGCHHLEWDEGLGWHLGAPRRGADTGLQEALAGEVHDHDLLSGRGGMSQERGKGANRRLEFSLCAVPCLIYGLPHSTPPAPELSGRIAGSPFGGAT